MYIPPGYVNIQWLFRGPNGRNALTAHGFEALALPNNYAEGCFIAWQQSALWQNMDDSWVLTGVRGIVGTSNPSEPIVSLHTGSAPGGNPGTAAPPMTSLLVVKRTNRGGRRGRGRCYVPGLPNDYVTDAGTIGGAVATFTTQWAALMTAVQSNSGVDTPVLLHSEELDGPPDPVTSWAVSATVATQRRRLRG